MQHKIESKAALDTIMRTLKGFGIEDTLVKQMSKRDLKKLNVASGFAVSVPYDVAVPFLLQDLENRFSSLAVFVTSTEKKSGIETETMVTDSSRWKIALHFTYNSEMKRRPFQITPLIRVPKDFSNEEFSKTLAGCDGISFLLPLSRAGAKQAERTAAMHCNYVVDLSEESGDQEYKLDAKFSKNRLNQSLEEILKSFPAGNFLYLRSNSPIHNSTVFPYIKAYLLKKKRTIFSEKELSVVPALMPQESSDQVVSRMVEQAKKTGRSIVTVGAAEKPVLFKILTGTEKLGSIRVPVDSVLNR